MSTLAVCLLVMSSCSDRERSETKNNPGKDQIKLVTLDPGHYHAALVQKSMYEQISPTAYVYAPTGLDVQNHLKHVQSFNERTKNPTNWQLKVYTGDDFLKKMLTEKPGDVVILSGNNRKKAEYIKAIIDSGLSVFCDKPMCINTQDFKLLEQAFDSAEQKGVLLYDIMTERFNITCILQKLLVHDKELFGEPEQGSAENPAVVKESSHYFFKYVSGIPIRRPGWYFDTTQQGEGLVDITTHLIDLVMWTRFSEQAIDYKKDVAVKMARRSPAMITRQQYEKVTGLPDFPDFLKGKLNNEGVLANYANGEMIFTLKGAWVKLAVSWDFQAPEGSGYTHHSLFRGRKANVIIRQGKEQNFRPEVYVEPVQGAGVESLAIPIKEALAKLQGMYPNLGIKQEKNGWRILIPDEYRIGHEAHFQKVTEKYLQYLRQGKLPAWEVPNMIAKYYITTRALDLARK